MCGVVDSFACKLQLDALFGFPDFVSFCCTFLSGAGFISFKSIVPSPLPIMRRPDTHELFYDLQVAEIANQPTTAEEWAQCYFKEKSKDVAMCSVFVVYCVEFVQQMFLFVSVFVAGSVGFYTLPDFQKTYNYSEESYKKAFESREGKALLKRTEDVAKELSELLESPLMDKKSLQSQFFTLLTHALCPANFVFLFLSVCGGFQRGRGLRMGFFRCRKYDAHVYMSSVQ